MIVNEHAQPLEQVIFVIFIIFEFFQLPTTPVDLEKIFLKKILTTYTSNEF